MQVPPVNYEYVSSKLPLWLFIFLLTNTLTFLEVFLFIQNDCDFSMCYRVATKAKTYSVLSVPYFASETYIKKSLVHGFVLSTLHHLIFASPVFLSQNKKLTDRFGFKLTTNQQPTMPIHYLEQSPCHSNRWFFYPRVMAHKTAFKTCQFTL
jgi:hypothetical protein